MNEPLTDRKARIQDIIEPSRIITPTMFVEGYGKALKELTVENDLEGIVANKKKSKYIHARRSTDWIKIKNFKLIDTGILGYRMPPNFALIVGLNFQSGHKPVALIEYGFKPEEKRAFLAIAPSIHTFKKKDIQWITPSICCRVQYLERTNSFNLRVTSFKGFVFDKKPEECRWAG